MQLAEAQLLVRPDCRSAPPRRLLRLLFRMLHFGAAIDLRSMRAGQALRFPTQNYRSHGHLRALRLELAIPPRTGLHQLLDPTRTAFDG